MAQAMDVPGMLSQEQLGELTDRDAQDDVAFKLASDMEVDHITETARMRPMLEALPPPQ